MSIHKTTIGIGIILLLVTLASATYTIEKSVPITMLEPQGFQGLLPYQFPAGFTNNETRLFDRVNISNKYSFLIQQHDNCEYNVDGARECVFIFNISGSSTNWQIRTNLSNVYTVNTPGSSSNDAWSITFAPGASNTSQYEIRFYIGDNEGGEFSVDMYSVGIGGSTQLLATLDPTYGCHTGNPCEADFCSASCPCNPWLDNYTAGDYFHCVDSVCGFRKSVDCDSNNDCTGLGSYCLPNAVDYGGGEWACTGGEGGSRNYDDACVVPESVVSSSSSSSSSTSSIYTIYSSSSSSAASTTSSSSSQYSSSSSTSSSSSSIISVSSSATSSSSSSSSSSIASNPTSSSAISSSSSVESSSSSSAASTTSSSSQSSSSAESSSSSSLHSTTSSSALSSSSSSSSSHVSAPTTTTLYFGQTYETDCSEYALLWKFNLTADNTMYKIDLSSIPSYVRPYLQNVNITREGGGHYNISAIYRLNTTNYTLIMNATKCVTSCGVDDDQIAVYVYGFEKNYIYSPNNIATTINYIPIEAIFTHNSNIYFITIKDELTNMIYSYNNATKMIATIKCIDHSSYIIDLESVNKNPFLVSTRQWPTVQIAIDDTNHTRSRVIPAGIINVSYFLLASPYIRIVDTFLLQDAIGQFPGPFCFMYAKKYISATQETVYSKQFDVNSAITEVDLMPNSDYSITVVNPSGNTYSFGILTATLNSTIYLNVIKPIIYSSAGVYSDLTAYLTKSDTSNSSIKIVGFTYSSNNTNNATFIVYNQSNNNSIVYNVSSTSDSGTFVYTIDTNYTYVITGILNDSVHGIVQETKTVSYKNVTGSAMNLGLSGTIMGFQASTILFMCAMGVSLLAMMVSVKTNNQTIGLIIGLMILGIFILAGWSNIPMRIISILLALVIGARMISGE